jgi:hypothetical protein
MPDFEPAAQLAGGFYDDVVSGLLSGHRHSAGLLGWGSDVLGFDTERSVDHGWGPRLTVLSESGDLDVMSRLLDDGLPASYRGWPVRYGWDDVPVQHWVLVRRPRDWLVEHLGVDATAPLSTRDWLATPQQKLLGVTAGPVFHDDDGLLAAVRTRLGWYPDDVWRWLVASQWARIAEHEPLVGRCAEVGDELGSRAVAGRLVRDLMRLSMLLARAYAPYDKWLGSAFRRDVDDPALERALLDVTAATSYTDRELALVTALQTVASRHNHLGLTDRLDPTTRPFHSRPYLVLDAGRFAAATAATVTDPELLALPTIGGIDQVVDTVGLTQPARWGSAVRSMYARLLADRDDVDRSRLPGDGR